MRVPPDFRSNFKEANQAHGRIVAQSCIAPAPGALKDCFDYTSSRSIGRYTFNRKSLRIVSCHRNSITDFFFYSSYLFQTETDQLSFTIFSYLKQRNPKKFSRNASSRISKKSNGFVTVHPWPIFVITPHTVRVETRCRLGSLESLRLSDSHEINIYQPMNHAASMQNIVFYREKCERYVSERNTFNRREVLPDWHSINEIFVGVRKYSLIFGSVVSSQFGNIR